MSVARTRQPSAKPKSADSPAPSLARLNLPKSWRSPGDRLLSAASTAKWELVADENGRPAVEFVLIGKIVGDVDSIVSRLEAVRIQVGKRGAK